MEDVESSRISHFLFKQVARTGPWFNYDNADMGELAKQVDESR